MTDRYRAVFLAEDGREVTLWTGSKAECLAYQAGAHVGSAIDYVVIVPRACSCGPERQEIKDGNFAGFARAGCLRCNIWDGPPVRVGCAHD
jgi:hypothetical protein